MMYRKMLNSHMLSSLSCSKGLNKLACVPQRQETLKNGGTVISFALKVRAMERVPVLGESPVSCVTLDKPVHLTPCPVLL